MVSAAILDFFVLIPKDGSIGKVPVRWIEMRTLFFLILPGNEKVQCDLDGTIRNVCIFTNISKLLYFICYPVEKNLNMINARLRTVI